jgi:diacylglycerol kinase family enzyme
VASQYACAVDERVCLIVNPAAGGGRAGRSAPGVQACLRRLGVRFGCEPSTDLAHARSLARRAALAGEWVFVLGGDGLAGAVADELRAIPDAVMAVLPGGRGNDLVRVLGLPSDPATACELLARGTPAPVDLGEVEGRAFLGIASVGFDSEANRIANEAPGWLGNLVYAYGALRALASWRAATFQITLSAGNGDRPLAGAARADPPAADLDRASSSPTSGTFTGYSVALANSKAYGGGMLLAPDASLQDGLLDIVRIDAVSRLRFLSNLPRVFKGTHVALPSVHIERATAAEISADRPFMMYADGEPLAALPVTVRALPGAIQMLVPATSDLARRP